MQINIPFQKNTNDALTDTGMHGSIRVCFRKRSTGTRPPSIIQASELRLFSRSFFMAGRSGASSGAPFSCVSGRSKPVRPATRTRPLVAGFGENSSHRGCAVSQGVKGRGTSDTFDVLTVQEASLTKLLCFISAAEFLVKHPSQADLLFALLDACRETTREIRQQNKDLHLMCLPQEKGISGARSERTSSPTTLLKD